VAGLAGGEVQREVGFHRDGAGVGPHGALVRREAGAELHAGEQGVVEGERERAGGRQFQERELLVLRGAERPAESERAGGVDGEAGVLREAGARRQPHPRGAVAQRPERVREPLQPERPGAGVGQLGAGVQGAFPQLQLPRQLVGEAGAGVAGLEHQLAEQAGDRPRAGGHDNGFTASVEAEAADAGREALVAAPSKRAAVAGAVAEGLGQALAVEGQGRGRGVLGAGEQRAQPVVVDLPDVRAPAETQALPRQLVRRPGIEHLHPEAGVGEGEHRADQRTRRTRTAIESGPTLSA